MKFKLNLDDPDYMEASVAAEKWGISDSRIRQRINEFPAGQKRKFGKQWVVTSEGMNFVFGEPNIKEEKKMKLYWAHNERYPEDIGYYPAESAEDLWRKLSIITEKSVEVIRSTYLYAEVDVIYDEETGKKFRVKLEEQSE